MISCVKNLCTCENASDVTFRTFCNSLPRAAERICGARGKIISGAVFLSAAENM